MSSPLPPCPIRLWPVEPAVPCHFMVGATGAGLDPWAKACRDALNGCTTPRRSGQKFAQALLNHLRRSRCMGASEPAQVTQRTLYRGELRLRGILDASDAAFISVDTEGLILDWNASAE